MLSFSGQQIILSYLPNAHLKTSFIITNNTTSAIFYKLKITRPKYYLVKPTKNILQPRQSLTLDISLHKEGVSECYNDKFKCFYKLSDRLNDDVHQDIEKMPGVESKRIPIKVMNLPDQYIKPDSRVNSQVKTIINMGDSRQSRQNTLEGVIAQKQERVWNLRNQIGKIANRQGKQQRQKQISFTEMALFLIGGVLIGGISSIWF